MKQKQKQKMTLFFRNYAVCVYINKKRFFVVSLLPASNQTAHGMDLLIHVRFQVEQPIRNCISGKFWGIQKSQAGIHGSCLAMNVRRNFLGGPNRWW